MSKNMKSNDASRTRRAMVGNKLSFSAAEAYKLLRTNVMFSLPDEESCRVFGMTSSLQGEGKSTTSINLAYTIAESDKRVLLIEMDMRLPVMHKALPIAKTPGLSNLLVGKSTPSEAVQKSGIQENLYVLTAGDLPPNPSELLSSERMRALLESFKLRFDYIICDLPPVTVVSDALTIAPLLSGMIVTVRSGYTDRRALDMTVRQLEFTQVKILGFVMTFADALESGGKKYGKYGKKRYGSYQYDYGYYAAAEQRRREEERRNNNAPSQAQEKEPAAK